uniref:Uncharacterized protein n=1 Tax=Pseudomonas aeruginosa TaxID=287 RepID=A0A6C0L3N2_PSEAI|nr:hypothetical protein [Pseudomonas aeruginosa]
MEGVKTEGTAERDCWRSKQSQMMRGAKRYGGVGSQIMFCRVSMRSYRMSLVTQWPRQSTGRGQFLRVNPD